MSQTGAPVIPEADDFTIIKNAAFPLSKTRTYKAVYDATKASKDSTQILPALNMAGSELNALAVSGLSLSHAKFAIVFHGAALDAIMNDEHYKAKYGVANPNLKVLAALKKNGVKLYVDRTCWLSILILKPSHQMFQLQAMHLLC